MKKSALFLFIFCLTSSLFANEYRYCLENEYFQTSEDGCLIFLSKSRSDSERAKEFFTQLNDVEPIAIQTIAFLLKQQDDLFYQIEHLRRVDYIKNDSSFRDIPAEVIQMGINDFFAQFKFVSEISLSRNVFHRGEEKSLPAVIKIGFRTYSRYIEPQFLFRIRELDPDIRVRNFDQNSSLAQTFFKIVKFDLFSFLHDRIEEYMAEIEIKRMEHIERERKKREADRVNQVMGLMGL